MTNSPLTPLQQRRIARELELAQVTAPELQALGLTLASLVFRIAGINAEQQHLLLQECYQRLPKLPLGQRPFLLAIQDGRYATFPDLTGFLDLETGEIIGRLPEPAVESLCYDVTEYHRRQHRTHLDG